MQLNDYTEFAKSEEKLKGTRIVVVPNADVAQRLTMFHAERGNDCRRIQLADCISADETFLPMPDIVFHQLMKKLKESDKPFIISGLHAYLILLDHEKVEQAFAKIKQLVDRPQADGIVLVSATSTWKNDLKKVFSNPGYQSGKQLIFLDGDMECRHPNVILVDSRWFDIQPPNCTSFKEFLERTGDFPAYEDETIVVGLSENDRKIAGLNTAVKQVHTLSDLMRVFFGVHDNLSPEVLKWILDISRKNNSRKTLDVLRQYFFNDDFNEILKTAPKRIADEHNAVRCSALRWCLKHSITENSYLYTVLSEQDLTGENFLLHYVARTPIRFLRDKNAARFAEERKSALNELGERKNSFIGQFIKQAEAESLQLLSPWLNNDTPLEHQELIRRYGELSNTTVYSALSQYLGDYDYGIKELTSYFKQYRKFKLLNTIDEPFCTKSFDLSRSLPSFPLRDPELTRILHADSKSTALLIVDAMGAEYLPLIIGKAAYYGLKIERHCVVRSHFPTTTKFNPIECECHKLSEIKTLDNIVHNGANQHQTNQYYENIAVVFDKVFPEIFDVISQNIHRYSRIILTADHGASRLAVLANELDFAKTLANPSTERPDDWRYIEKPQGKDCPNEFIETLDGHYWVVHGYNRLPKQGGKQYELHGGYTPEEILVPFVVFSRFAQEAPPKEQPTSRKQIVEKDEFADF